MRKKPFLLLALDDYFSDPSQDCLARLFDAVNSMDLSLVPWLTRHEKLVMRFSERKDIFAEKFPPIVPRDAQLCNACGSSHGTTSTCDRPPSTSRGSISSFEDGFLGDETDSESRRKSQDASSASSHLYGKDTGQQVHATLPGYCDNHAHFRTAITKDTHFYHTIVAYRDHHLPIKLPLSTFPEEVGDVRLVPCLK
jgi:hypothetical protein